MAPASPFSQRIPSRLSYGFIFLVLALVCLLHMATPFITVLFSYFALRVLSFGRRKWLAVFLFLLLLSAAAFGFYYFIRYAYVAFPKILQETIPVIAAYGKQWGFDVPFADLDGLKDFARETFGQKLPVFGQFATAAKALRFSLVETVSFIIGVVAAVSMFLNGRFQLDAPHTIEENNLYALTWESITERFRTFYDSFRTVMGAQIAISAINTALTTAFVQWNHFPHAWLIAVFTFLCGLLPIIGNLISNTLIVAIGFTISPKMAIFALVFLVVLHKLEYFLNGRIVGHHIKNPMWLTLLGLIIGEKLMGIPGMVLTPVVLHYIKVEASKRKVLAHGFEELPQANGTSTAPRGRRASASRPRAASRRARRR